MVNLSKLGESHEAFKLSKLKQMILNRWSDLYFRWLFTTIIQTWIIDLELVKLFCLLIPGVTYKSNFPLVLVELDLPSVIDLKLTASWLTKLSSRNSQYGSNQIDPPSIITWLQFFKLSGCLKGPTLTLTEIVYAVSWSLDSWNWIMNIIEIISKDRPSGYRNRQWYS